MRVLSSFLATVFIAILAIAVLFPPQNPSDVASYTQSLSEPPQGHFKTEVLAIKASANHPNRRDYAAPETIGRSHVFTYETQKGQQRQRTWYAFKPGGFGPFPTVVLLHGSNRSGRAMIDMWQTTAQREGIFLIAPDAQARSHWSLSEDGPEFIEAMLTDAAKSYEIDRNRLYLMGHSAGGIFGQMLAVKNKNHWRYIATHGGSREFNLTGYAANATHIGIYTGDQDHLHPPAKTHLSSKALAGIGHQVTAYDIPDHTHWYYVIGPNLADHMWDQMQSVPREAP